MSGESYSILIDPGMTMLNDSAYVVAQKIADAIRHPVIITFDYTTKQKTAIRVDAAKAYAGKHVPWAGFASTSEESRRYMFVVQFGSWKAKGIDEARYAAMCISEAAAFPVSLIPKKIRPPWGGRVYPKAGWSVDVIWRDSAAASEGLKSLAVDSKLNEVFFGQEKAIWSVTR